MKLSQSVTYAIHAILRLAAAADPRPVSCCKLAEEGRMPERFLLQILRDLAKQGILQSTRGGGGGFTLGRRPEEISLLEVIEAVDGPLIANLPLRDNFPDQVGNRLQNALEQVAESARQHLKAISICQLMSGKQLPALAQPVPYSV